MNKLFQPQPFDLDVEKSFKDSFGGALNISEDTFGAKSAEYYNPWTGVNKLEHVRAAHEVVAKASIDSQTGGAGTAGTALIPVWVDNVIVDRTAKLTPVRAMYPRRAVRGLTYDYIPLTAKGGASWEYENAAISDQVDTYDRVSVPIKFLYAKGRVSKPAMAGAGGFLDLAQLDLSVKTASIMEAEEDAIINGDTSTNPQEPNGLITSITTNTTAVSGLPTLAGIRAEFATSFNNNGLVTLAITDATTHNYIKGLLLDLQRQVTNPSQAVLGFGIPDAFDFDGVMFIKSRFMPTGANVKRILFVDMRYAFMAVLQDMTYEEKASENDSVVYLLKEYLTPVLTHEAACTQMTTID